jgi:cytochrome c-type biogenesis protein CcmH/NrfG
VHTIISSINLEIDRHPRNRQRMTQRHQIAGALGAHDRGNPGDAEHVTFLGRAGLDQG